MMPERTTTFAPDNRPTLTLGGTGAEPVAAGMPPRRTGDPYIKAVSSHNISEARIDKAQAAKIIV